MNSRRFSARVSPRTMRAVVSHPTAPSAISNAARLPRGSRLVRMMTMKRYGSEYSTSTKRIISSSVRPPANPATAPKLTPIARLTRLASTLMSSERRSPESVRTKRSRPSRSVPNQCAARGARGLRQVLPVEAVKPPRAQPRPEEREHRDEGEQAERPARAGVRAEPPPRIAIEAARCAELPPQPCRTPGSSQPYSRSTRKFISSVSTA